MWQHYTRRFNASGHTVLRRSRLGRGAASGANAGSNPATGAPEGTASAGAPVDASATPAQSKRSARPFGVVAVAGTAAAAGYVAYQYGDLAEWQSASLPTAKLQHQAQAVARGSSAPLAVHSDLPASAVATDAAATKPSVAEVPGPTTPPRQNPQEPSAQQEPEERVDEHQVKREALLAAINEALDTAEAAPLSSEALLALRQAILAAESEREPLSLDEGSLSEARGRLAVFEAKRREHAALEAAKGELRDAVNAGELDTCRAALAAVENMPGHDGTCELVSEARAKILELEEAARVAAMRAAAQAALEAAVESRDAQQCREALAAATEAGVEPSRVANLAAVLADPERLHQQLFRMQSPKDIAQMRKAARDGLRLQDIVNAAATVAAASDDVEHLRNQVEELARAIARNSRLESQEFLAEWMVIVKPDLAQRNTNRAINAADRIVSAKEQALKSQEFAAKDASAARTQAACAKVVAAEQARAEAACAGSREALMQEAALCLAGETEEFQSRFDAMAPGVQSLDTLMHEGSSLRQRSAASSALSTSTMALEAVLLQGRSAHAEIQALREAGAGPGDDGFVARLLSSLPAETLDRSRFSVPTEMELQRSFREHLGDFVAGAFVPPRKEGDGLMYRAASHIAGGIFGHMYKLRAHIDDAPPTGPREKNLSTLFHASRLVERGELRLAVDALEAEGALAGECRERAHAWVAEVRNALLLQQAARVAQAKVRCLNAVLAE